MDPLARVRRRRWPSFAGIVVGVLLGGGRELARQAREKSRGTDESSRILTRAQEESEQSPEGPPSSRVGRRAYRHGDLGE